jgi:hypothetical protein
VNISKHLNVFAKMVPAGAVGGILALSACAGGTGSSMIPSAVTAPSIANATGARPHAVCAAGIAGCFTLIKPIAAAVVHNVWTMAAAQTRATYCSGTTIAASKPQAVAVNGLTVSVAPLGVTFACMQDAAVRASSIGSDSAPAGTDIYIVAVPTYASPTAVSVPATVVSGPALKTPTGTGLQFPGTTVAIPAGSVYFYFASCSGC